MNQEAKTERGQAPVRQAGVLLVLLFLFGTGDTVLADDEDLQLWSPIQIIHAITDDVSLSMQIEGRFQRDISKFSELVLKPAVNYHFNDVWGLSAGYKFIEKYEGPNEQDPWQELIYTRHHGELVTKLQLRLEERLIGGIDGILPRVRLLGHLAHPIGDSPYYLTGWGAVRFNLDDKGEGPVSGFEQLRLYAGIGRSLNDHVQVEFGYLWRYEEKRVRESLTDHALHLQFVIHTDGRLTTKPHGRDQYR
jgi:hypothetical protein